MNHKPHSQADVKLHNTWLVLDLIRHRGPLSRADLARRTGLSATSMTRIVTKLARAGLVRELAEPQPNGNGAGRPGTQLSFVRDRGYIFCVDAGPVISTVALMDLGGDILHRHEIEMPEGTTFDAFREMLAAELKRLTEEADLDAAAILGCGVSVAGHVLPPGYLVASSQLKWSDLEIGRPLAEELGLPVHVENDCKAAIQGERALLEKNGFSTKDIAFIKFGWRGVGSAAIVDGNLLRGSRNAAGEIGILGAQPEGRHEGKYRHEGSLDNTLSIQGILAGAKEIDAKYDSLAAVDRGLYEEEPELTAYMDGVCERMAIAIGSVLNVFNSERVILNGGLFRECRGVFRQVVDYLERRRVRSVRPYIKIVLAKHGRDDCLYGIGCLAVEEAIGRILQDKAEDTAAGR